MREMPDIVDRRSALPVGLAVTGLLAAWACARPLPPGGALPLGAWVVPTLVAVQAGLSLAMVLVLAGFGGNAASGGDDRAARRHWWQTARRDRASPLAWVGFAVAQGVPLVCVVAAWRSGRGDVLVLARLLGLLAAWQAMWFAMAAFWRGITLTAVAGILAVPALILFLVAAVSPAAPPVIRPAPITTTAAAPAPEATGLEDHDGPLPGASPATDAPAVAAALPTAPAGPSSDLNVAALLLTLAVSSLAAIAWAAVPQPRGETVRTWLGLALLVDGVGLWLLALAWDGGLLSLMHLLKLYLLLGAWLAALTAMGLALRRWGPGPATAIPAAAAILLLALPVTATPLLRALQRPGGSTAERTLGVLAYASPTFGVIDAIRDPIGFNWREAGARVMYLLTPLGDSFAWPTVSWWRQAAVLAAAAGALVGARHAIHRWLGRSS